MRYYYIIINSYVDKICHFILKIQIFGENLTKSIYPTPNPSPNPYPDPKWGGGVGVVPTKENFFKNGHFCRTKRLPFCHA